MRVAHNVGLAANVAPGSSFGLPSDVAHGLLNDVPAELVEAGPLAAHTTVGELIEGSTRSMSTELPTEDIVAGAAADR